MATTTTKRRKPSTAQLQSMVEDAIIRADAQCAVAPAVPTVEPSMGELDLLDEPGARELPQFGTWLLGQVNHRREWIAALAKAAKADPRFPRRGDPEAVRKHMGDHGADVDVFEAIDDAENEWLKL